MDDEIFALASINPREALEHGKKIIKLLEEEKLSDQTVICRTYYDCFQVWNNNHHYIVFIYLFFNAIIIRFVPVSILKSAKHYAMLAAKLYLITIIIIIYYFDSSKMWDVRGATIRKYKKVSKIGSKSQKLCSSGVRW